MLRILLVVIGVCLFATSVGYAALGTMPSGPYVFQTIAASIVILLIAAKGKI